MASNRRRPEGAESNWDRCLTWSCCGSSLLQNWRACPYRGRLRDKLVPRVPGSAGFLHDALGLVDLRLPLLEGLAKLSPGDDFDPVVPALRELNPVRALDPTWSKAFRLRLLDGAFDAHRF